MPANPYSQVIGRDPDESTFKDVINLTGTDTTTLTSDRPPDDPTNPAGGVVVDSSGDTHVNEQDETVGAASSGASLPD